MTSHAATKVHIPGLGMSLGAIQMGVLVSSVLWGVTCVQMYLYAMSPKNDRLGIRSFVAFIFILETLLTVFTWIYFFDLTVNHYADPTALGEIPWHLITAFGLHIAISCFVQGFFSYRVWMISRRLWLALPGAAMALTRFIVGCMIGAYMSSLPLETFQHEHKYLIDIALSLSTVVDTWNTVALCYYLAVASERTAFNKTSELLNAIIVMTMETGLALVILSLFELAAWVAAPKTALWICALLIYARIYSNSLLVSLNARNSRSRQGLSGSNTLGTISFGPSGQSHTLAFHHTGETEMNTVDLSRQLGDREAPSSTFRGEGALKDSQGTPFSHYE